MNSKRMFRILYKNLKKRKLNNCDVNLQMNPAILPIEKVNEFSIRNLTDKKIKQIKDSLERQRIGGSLTLDKKLNYAVRKIQKFYFPEHKYRIVTIENKIKVFKIN